jgi:agmatine/peptidylarginine deiminase
MVAEWEPANGTLIRWPLGFPMALAVELAEDDTLYTLVEGQSGENQAKSAFQSAGIDVSMVRFIRTDTYSMWTRDWGPQCVFGDDGQMGIVDPWFDGYPWVPGCAGKDARDVSRPPTERGYEDDDVINADVAAALGLPLHELPAYCTGGNIMTDGHGRAFSTEQMLDENAPWMSSATFFSRAEDYLGITDYEILPNPEVHGIQHIDCYAKLLNEETVLVKEVPTWHPEYQCIEDLVDAFENLTTCYGRPYEIVRIWCAPYSGDEVAAYTNSLILNGKVLVPTFGIAADADALATYESAMPGYEVIGISYASWYYYDALHCRTMGIFDPGMLHLTHARLDNVVPAATSHEVLVVASPMSGSGLVPGAQLVRWRLAGEIVWNEQPLLPTLGDTLLGTIPAQTPGNVVEYYVTASDSSGRTETLPRTAPAGFYSFQVDPSTGVTQGPSGASLTLAASPTPLRDATELSFDLPAEVPVRLDIYDVRGRRVASVLDDVLPPGCHRVPWTGFGSDGARVPSGIYFARLSVDGAVATAKLVVLR